MMEEKNLIRKRKGDTNGGGGGIKMISIHEYVLKNAFIYISDLYLICEITLLNENFIYIWEYPKKYSLHLTYD